jgi:hypothetical protein
VRLRNKDGHMPLHLLVSKKRNNVEGNVDLTSVEYLVDEHQEALTTENNHHETPFDLAVALTFPTKGTGPCTSSFPSKHDYTPAALIEILRILTPRLPCFQMIDTALSGTQQLPLHYLLSRPQWYSGCVMKILLELSPEACFQRNQFGELPLHVASSTPCAPLDVIEYLFDQNPDAIQTTTKDGLFPFQLAAISFSENKRMDRGDLGVLYFLVHRSLFAFENLVCLRDHLLRSRLWDVEAHLENEAKKPDNHKRSGPKQPTVSSTLMEVLQEQRAWTDARLSEFEREVNAMKKDRERERLSQTNCHTSCCTIS